jgi:Dyp-type peroxidase family
MAASGAVDLRNVQGLVVQPYRYKLSRQLLFEFGTGSGAKGFLSALLPRITTGGVSLDGGTPLLYNVALTYSGLQQMGQPAVFLNSLDPMLEEGPNAASLGDTPGSPSDPANWWEKQFSTARIHCMVQIFARNLCALDEGTAGLLRLGEPFGLRELIPRSDGTRLDGQALSGGRVHFGYKDGISQPHVCWSDVPPASGQLHYRHFLLGYATSDVFSSPGDGPVAEAVRDSSYVVLRWVYQDVAAYNRFLESQGPILAPHLSPVQARELLAAKLIGRWRSGAPLVLSPDRPSDGLASEASFSYALQDPTGAKCPFSAHIRVCNPRDEQLETVQALEGVPRLVRRGMPYGPEMEPTLTTDDGVDRGLIGLFVCSSIRRQFYTLTRWISENSFSPVFEASRHVQDPLMGNRHYPGAVSDFLIPTEGSRVTVKGLPEFVRTKGTAFFLLPSIGTLHFLIAS